MASIYESAQRRETRSGGKILRRRRTVSRATPYDRPRLLNSTEQNPNWISRNVFSPTRAFVSGATRVISSVFGFESPSSSSSDSGSTSDDASGTNDRQDVSSQGLDNIEHGKPQYFAGKIETKRLIEQLLVQESFSKEECDKLTNIIKSRVVDSPMLRGMGIERLDGTPIRAGGSGVDNHDLCGTAVIEAKKWLEEKKSGSNSKSELQHGTSARKFVTLAHSIEGEAGSPVDMAKTYMRTRPPWASPAMSDIEFKSPLPLGMPLFKEETPYSIGEKYLSSSKKRDSPATGSWNIQEEIRKVRSKATEEMLRTLSSPKIDWSLFALEQKSAPDSLAARNLVPGEENNPAPQIPEDALNSDVLPIPATLVCEDNQGMEAVQSTERKGGETLDEGQRLQSTVDIKTASNSDVAADVNHFKDANGSDSILQFGFTREGIVQGSHIVEENRGTLKVAKTGRADATYTANGLPSLGYSMPAETDTEQNQGPINEENAVGSGDENATRVVAKAQSKASIEVASVNENNVAVSDSLNSSSMQHEGSGSLEQLSTPKSKRNMAGKSKSNSGMENQPAKKVSRNTRRGKGRVR